MADYVGTVLVQRPNCLFGKARISMAASGRALVAPTMRPCDFAPYYSNLGPTHLSVRPVDKCDFLAKIETEHAGSYESMDPTAGV